MLYQSTRDASHKKYTAAEVIKMGLAPDGGLFIPESIPALTAEEIAALCAMSPVSVKQTFSRYAGMGVVNYFNRLKVQAAAAMLREGASVQETAAALGFSSQNYFSTVFKRIQGESPTAYKDQVFGK